MLTDELSTNPSAEGSQVGRPSTWHGVNELDLHRDATDSSVLHSAAIADATVMECGGTRDPMCEFARTAKQDI